MKVKVRTTTAYDTLRRFDAIYIVRVDDAGNPCYIFRDGMWELISPDEDNEPTFVVPSGLIPNFERINDEDE